MDRGLKRAMHLNTIHALQTVADALSESCVERAGPWLLYDSGVGTQEFNLALRLAPVRRPATALAAAEAWFDRRGAPFVLSLRDPDDDALLAAARERGYRELRSQPAMLLSPLPLDCGRGPGLEVQTVTDSAGVSAYASVEAEEPARHAAHRAADEALAAAVLSTPGIRLFVGLVDDAPVARSMAVVSAEMVGVTNVYVAPSARRRGLGTAMTTAAISAGVELGATAACLEASRMGEPVYQRMGFREVFRYVRMAR
jgi:GNAT superfamily N-acetyltransferase